MRTITFYFDALTNNTTQSWEVDRDAVIAAVVGNTSFSVSFDPAMTNQIPVGPTRTEVSDGFLIPGNASNLPNLSFPIEAGRTLFVNANATGFVQLYLIDPVPAS